MTLEQSGQAALHAAASGNLDELQDALRARAAAITMATEAEPSGEVRARLLAAVEIGKAIQVEIRALKLRIAGGSTRLSQIQAYFD